MFTEEQYRTATAIARAMTKGLAPVEPPVRILGLALFIAADIALQARDEEDATVKFEAFAGMASAQITAIMRDASNG